LKNIFVFWSGGHDSTCALIKQLEKEPENKYILCYVDVENNSGKSKNEQSAIRSILRILKDKFITTKFETRQIKVSLSYHGIPNLIQQMLWSFSIQLFVNREEKIDSVVFGYIQGDDYWHIKNQCESILKLVFSVNQTSGNKDLPVDIVYPCEWTTKEEVINFYKQNDTYKCIKSLVETCENPLADGRPCGVCHTCNTLKDSVALIDVQSKRCEKQECQIADTPVDVRPSIEK